MTAQNYSKGEVTENPYMGTELPHNVGTPSTIRLMDKSGKMIVINPPNDMTGKEAYLINALLIYHLNYDFRFDVLGYLEKHDLMRCVEVV